MSRFIEAFGPDRVVWASNGPICNLHGSLERWVSVDRRISLEKVSGVPDRIFPFRACRDPSVQGRTCLRPSVGLLIR